ncbi:MAG: hypothetical protein WCJ58_02970 [bacterium]
MDQKNVQVSIKRILPESKKSFFGVMDIYPVGMRFATQNPGEVVYIKARSHVLTNFGWLFNTLVAFVIPVFLIIIFNSTEIIFGNSTGYKFFGVFLQQIGDVFALLPLFFWITAALIYFSSIVTYALINFTNWYYNIYLVTNERLMHIRIEVFSGKHIVEATLNSVEEISERDIGFFPTIFHYGDIRVQTEAHKSTFFFKSVPDTTWFRDTLADLVKLVQDNEP